jgi:hypothetical protein
MEAGHIITITKERWLLIRMGVLLMSIHIPDEYIALSCDELYK